MRYKKGLRWTIYIPSVSVSQFGLCLHHITWLPQLLKDSMTTECGIRQESQETVQLLRRKVGLQKVTPPNLHNYDWSPDTLNSKTYVLSMQPHKFIHLILMPLHHLHPPTMSLPHDLPMHIHMFITKHRLILNIRGEISFHMT